ncbi:branched-chain amino acid transport system permease protein [Nocardiopsis composta]|uniref:Branched-chain amino acid transport system permease protein n=1 Tax=Nocardiopsis composta TaxID=157465 RepID=A0A7W8VH56_9ACTN|nr:branched-chain amino acid transport system permease protein [Nocardiopsis composta]
MRTRLVTVLLAVIAAFMVIPGAAAADAQGGENLNGQIRQPTTVEGLEITVYEGAEGDEVIGEATTDSEGRWEVELPGPGDYRVVLDEESVPDEYVVPEKPGSELVVEVRPDQQRTVVFRLQTPEEAAEQSASPSAEDDEEGGAGAGEDGAAEEEGAEAVPGVDAGASFGDKFVQLTVAGVIFGLIIAISSVGLSLIFGTTKMINFAHGDMVTFGAFMAMMFSTMTVLTSLHESVENVPVLGFLLNPLVVGLVLAVVLGGGLGMFLERFLWRPLRKRHVALIQMFIVTIGVSLILRHVLLVVFGARREKYEQFRIQQPLELGPVSITPRDLTVLLLSVVVLVLVASMLQFTRIGKAMRAVADNRDLAESSGIDVDRVTLYVWGLGGSLSALGGVFYGLNQTVHWQMGFHLLLLMFAGVILGGLGTAYGAMVGGLVVGLVAMLSTLWFSPQLMNVWALGIMILVLLVRPQGILGRRERVG